MGSLPFTSILLGEDLELHVDIERNLTTFHFKDRGEPKILNVDYHEEKQHILIVDYARWLEHGGGWQTFEPEYLRHYIRFPGERKAHGVSTFFLYTGDNVALTKEQWMPLWNYYTDKDSYPGKMFHASEDVLTRWADKFAINGLLRDAETCARAPQCKELQAYRTFENMINLQKAGYSNEQAAAMIHVAYGPIKQEQKDILAIADILT